MRQICWLPPNSKPEFPSTTMALDEPNGLLAFGGELNTPWLLNAYRNGIFPWFSDDEPIMWWSPSPRMVLKPGTAHISRSLRKLFKKLNIKIYTNRSFDYVVDRCSSSKLRIDGTWITPDMKLAYGLLHKEGWAHSVEVWQDQRVIGGLYGVGIDRTFFGESMFSESPSASKFAFIALSEWAASAGLTMIDCQLYNPYLASLGASLIGRIPFEKQLPQAEKRLSLVQKPELTEYLSLAMLQQR